MRINATNNNFAGRTKALSNLAQKAEKRLQQRLVHPSELMLSFDNTYYNVDTWKVFSGKFGISTDALEQFFHVKNGKLYATLVRGKDGSKKVGGFGIGRMRLWEKHPDAAERRQLAELSREKDLAYAGMNLNYFNREREPF